MPPPPPSPSPGVRDGRGGGALPISALLGMCHWEGSLFAGWVPELRVWYPYNLPESIVFFFLFARYFHFRTCILLSQISFPYIKITHSSHNIILVCNFIYLWLILSIILHQVPESRVQFLKVSPEIKGWGLRGRTHNENRTSIQNMHETKNETRACNTPLLDGCFSVNKPMSEYHKLQNWHVWEDRARS